MQHSLLKQADQLLMEPASGEHMFGVAMKLKQAGEFDIAIRLLRLSRDRTEDEALQKLIGAQLLTDGNKYFARVQRFFGYDFFISHAHADARGYAEALCRARQAARYRCFLDKEEAAAGSDLTNALRSGLCRSAALLLIGSPKSLSAPYVATELAAFTLLGRPVTPLDVAGALSGREWQDYQTKYGIADYIRVSETAEAFVNSTPVTFHLILKILTQ